VCAVCGPRPFGGGGGALLFWVWWRRGAAAAARVTLSVTQVSE
jgi:hypothetical protein